MSPTDEPAAAARELAVRSAAIEARLRARSSYYQVLYNLAAARAHAYLSRSYAGRGGKETTLELRGAQLDARALLLAAATRLLEVAGGAAQDDGSPDRVSAEFLTQTVEPCAALLWAGLHVVEPATHVELDVVTGLLSGERRPPGAPPSQPAADEAAVRRQIAGWQSDEVPRLDILVPYAVRRRGASARTHYNAACFWSGAIEKMVPHAEADMAQRCAEESLGELTNALQLADGPERRQMLRNASNDPSLTPLRESDHGRAQFVPLLCAFGDSEQHAKAASGATSPLAT